MHRFYLPPSACQGSTLILSDQEAQHALHVLRVRLGERVVVLDGDGKEYLCEMSASDRHTVTLAVRQQSVLPRLPRQIVLIQAVTKAKSMELIIQKATELGATRIVPVLSERSVPHLEGEDASKRADKWRGTAIEAIKQCGSPWLPEIEPPLTPTAFLGRNERFELSLLASLQPGSRHPGEYFRAFVSEHQRLPATVAVWVGPEGDFTPAELNLIKGAGGLPITLGPLVLRSETAALYCLSVLSYELQAA